MINAAELEKHVRPNVRRLWAAVTLLFISFILGGAILSYYVWFEPSWLIYPNPELPTAVEQVVAGEVIPLYVRRTSTDTRLRVYAIARELHCDAFNRPAVMEPTVAEIRPGDNAGISYINRIPEKVTLENFSAPQPMPTAVCWIEGAVETQGKIRTIPVSWHTNKFKVLSKADAQLQGITS